MKRIHLLYILFFAVSVTIGFGCNSSPDAIVTSFDAEPVEVSAESDYDAEDIDEDGVTDVARDSDEPNYYEHLDSMPDAHCVKLHVNSVGGSPGQVFADLNPIHLEAARRLGLGYVGNAHDAWHIKRPVVRVKSCANYFVDNLTHSVPYLVPEAEKVLSDIGQRFNDTLKARGGGDYRIKVTSVLRTEGSVKKLRRRNRNASAESAHCFGTTFDISYSKFICDSATVVRSQEDLKNLLAEVLFQMRQEQRCYVKYERRQACFHITARK